MTKESFKAKVTRDDDGTILVKPYAHTEHTRYPVVKKTLHGSLSETGSTFRLLISVSKGLGKKHAAEVMLDEATQAAEFLYNL